MYGLRGIQRSALQSSLAIPQVNPRCGKARQGKRFPWKKIRLCWGGCPYPAEGKGRGAFCIFWDIHVRDQWGQQELAGPFPWFCRPRARARQTAEAAAGVSVVGQGQESSRHGRVTCQQGLWKRASPPLQDKSRALAVFIIFWTLLKASVNDYICFLEWVKLLATQKCRQMFSSVTELWNEGS